VTAVDDHFLFKNSKKIVNKERESSAPAVPTILNSRQSTHCEEKKTEKNQNIIIVLKLRPTPIVSEFSAGLHNIHSHFIRP
jgi:hypothetical protein